MTPFQAKLARAIYMRTRQGLCDAYGEPYPLDVQLYLEEIKK